MGSLDSQGLVGGYDDPGASIKTLLAALTAIALYNAVEITFIILSVFKKYKGLYFWSLFLSALFGVIPYSIGFLLKFFQLGNIWAALVLLTLGCERALRNVLVMIIVDAVAFHITTSFFTFGSNVRDDPLFITGYGVMERVQMTGFCIQEFIISGLYIYSIINLLSLFPDTSKRKLMYQLLGINFFIVLMDIALLAIEYANLYAIQITLKGVVYSVKLKLELAVLSNLVDLIQPRRHQSENSGMVEYI